jgi:hypothetical protein
MFSTGKIQGYVFHWENLRLCFPLRKFKVMFSTAKILMYYYRSLQLGMSKFMFSIRKSLRITTEVFNWEKSKVMFSTEKMFIYYCRSLQLENPRLFFSPGEILMYYYRSLIMHYYTIVHVCLVQNFRMNNTVVFMPRCLLQFSCMF